MVGQVAKRWTGVLAGAAVVGMAVFSGAALGADWMPAAHAMGQQQQPPANIYLAPDTVTVQGVAQLPAGQYVSQISESLNINDTTPKAIVRDETAAVQEIRLLVEKLGVPSGDIMAAPNGFNGGSNQSGMLNVTVNVPVKVKVASVLAALASYSPSFSTNSYVNVQPIPLNPAAQRRQLFAAAVADARVQAQLLAKDAGKSLGAVEAVSTLNPQGNAVGMAGPYPTSGVVGGVQNGNMYGPATGAPTLSTQVTVTFALR